MPARPGDATERMEALTVTAGEDPAAATVKMHRAIALRLLREGHAGRAFTELILAAREVPMSARLAWSLGGVALRAGTHSAAIALLEAGVEEADELERTGIRRALARLLRRVDELERAREQLVLLLAESPTDRRARAVLNGLLEREERWDELDASLEKETREAQRRGALRAASRSTLRRARLWGERLKNPSRAALRYGQAAQYAAQGEDLESAFLLRLLWLRALHQSQAPARVLMEAMEQALDSGDAVGKTDRVRALAHELGLVTDAEPDLAAQARTVEMPAAQVPAPPAPATRRRSTQIELMAVVEEVEKQGPSHKPEVAALLAAAVDEGPDPQTLKRLEAHYVARASWRELATFYRDRANQADTRAEKVEALEKLAELLESELDDAMGAAKVYAELVGIGDHRAVTEQVRLLSARKDAHGVRAALDESVQSAGDDQGRAEALVLRAEDALARREPRAAREDFEQALRAVPTHPAAAAGLAELAAEEGDAAPARHLAEVLKTLPRRRAGRAELYRRMARLADAPLREPKMARDAWAEVLAELGEDEEASLRLAELSRSLGDDAQLERVLRAQLLREPRSARARKTRLELVAVLEKQHRFDEAVEELRAAVRFEPGHKEAWLALADRLLDRREFEHAAWALEHGATSTEDGYERLRTWQRLARVCREQLRDDARAAACDARVDKLKRELGTALPATPLGGRLDVPRPKSSPGRPRPRGTGFDEVAEALGARKERDPPRPPRALPALDATPVQPPSGEVADEPSDDDLSDDDWEGSTVARPDTTDSGDISVEEALSGEDDVVEVGTADVEPLSAEWKAQLEAKDERHTAEVPVALGDPSTALAPSSSMSSKVLLTAERKQLFEQVRANPLEPDGYRLLAEHFDTAGDSTRSSLMLEIALAIEGDPNAAPRAPRLILSATDRAGLKHPSLRGESGELMGLSGLALCRLFPARTAGREEFRLDAGKGAKAAADALLAGVRILGLRSPDVYLSEDNGPPFALVHTTPPRLLVGRLAVKRELPEAELRFFAGRALFTQNPDLLALRSLRREQLQQGLLLLGQVLTGKANSIETRVVRDALPSRSYARLKELFEKIGRRLDLQRLGEGARHSANRAGLVVAGSVAPALAALKAKKALPAEVLEVVRFAASERYLLMRTRRLGTGKAPPRP